MKEDRICTACCAVNFVTAKKTFLGNPRFVCGTCRAEVLHPLTSGTAITYLIILGLCAVASVVQIVSYGRLPIPGLMLLAVIYALGRDVRIRRRLKDARLRRIAMLRESRAK